MTSIISGKTLQNLRKNQGGLYIVEFAVVGLAAQEKNALYHLGHTLVGMENQIFAFHK